MARNRTRTPDWVRIKSEALDLPYYREIEQIDLRPQPTERQIPIAKIRSIATKTNCRALSETEIETLDILVNDALLFFYRSRAADTSSLTAKQLAKAYENFHRAIKALVKSLPESRAALFWAVADKGDAFARKMGPHPGMQPYKAGVSSPVSDQWLIFRSEERLDEFCNLTKQVSSWMTGSFSPPKTAAKLSPSVWLIGEDLPKIYERIFGQKYGNGDSGPGHRFVEAVLEAAAIQTGAGKPFKAGTIKTYRTRAISRLHAG
jgi:hypothetical protein